MEEPPKPKLVSPEDVSAIPPEILKQLNLVPETPKPAAPAGDDLADIPPEVLLKIREISGRNPLGQEPGGFSWAALVYGPFYYIAMKDWLFAILSAVASISLYGIPALIPLAFFARKRAWNYKTWENEDVFWKLQKKWDRSAVIGGIVSVVALYFIGHYVYGMLSSTFGTTDPNEVLKQVQSLSM